MNKELYLQINQELQYAVDHTIAEFEKLGLHVQVELIENDIINAAVGKVRNTEKTYQIQINTGVIESLKLALEEKYMVAINEKDFLQYQFASTDSLHHHFDDSTLKNSFMNVLVRFISYSILYHECGHVLLGHCDGRLSKITEHNNSGSRQGGYGLQAREMMADWYGIKTAMNVLLFSFAHNCEYKITNNDDLLILRKALLLSLFALYCQFDLFEATGVGDPCEFSEYALERRTHPHPYIRLLYGCDAVKEATMDVVESYNQMDSNTSEQIVSELLNTVIDDLLNFLEKMGLNNIKFDLFRPELIECHYLIRKKAASKKHSSKPYINMQMQKIPKEYLNSLRECKKIAKV